MCRERSVCNMARRRKLARGAHLKNNSTFSWRTKNCRGGYTFTIIRITVVYGRAFFFLSSFVRVAQYHCSIERETGDRSTFSSLPSLDQVPGPGKVAAGVVGVRFQVRSFASLLRAYIHGTCIIFVRRNYMRADRRALN